ncbi:MAG: signal peptidase I [Patescibacteria group bacterium]
MLFSRKNAGTEEHKFMKWFGPTLGAFALFVVEIVQIAVLALAIILPVRYFLIQPFIVKGASMEPNFYDSEYLIIDELTFHFRNPERGEIVVFRPPQHTDQYYIKRVIGLPGETVEIRNGVITIYNNDVPNGFTLTESYISEVTEGRDRRTLGPDEYYVMGDNRDASLDSRYFGAVPRENLVGRVWVRGLPIDRAMTFAVPTYSE